MYWAWVKQHHPGKVSSWQAFDRCKVTIHALERLGVYAEMEAYCGQHVDFLQARKVRLISFRVRTVASGS